MENPSVVRSPKVTLLVMSIKSLGWLEEVSIQQFCKEDIFLLLMLAAVPMNLRSPRVTLPENDLPLARVWGFWISTKSSTSYSS